MKILEEFRSEKPDSFEIVLILRIELNSNLLFFKIPTREVYPKENAFYALYFILMDLSFPVRILSREQTAAEFFHSSSWNSNQNSDQKNSQLIILVFSLSILTVFGPGYNFPLIWLPYDDSASVKNPFFSLHPRLVKE